MSQLAPGDDSMPADFIGLSHFPHADLPGGTIREPPIPAEERGRRCRGGEQTAQLTPFPPLPYNYKTKASLPPAHAKFSADLVPSTKVLPIVRNLVQLAFRAELCTCYVLIR
jgi:hypothetical protein